MGVELLNVVIKMRDGVMFTIKGCFRAVCNHPFLVCLLSVLIYMYRSSPLMFSLLVYASPILVCTAVLLGTLLFFGQPNIPEIGIKEETSGGYVPQKTELLKDGGVEKNERRGELEKRAVGSSLSESKRDEICSESSVDVAATFNKKRSQETELGSREVLETNRELGERRGEQKSEWNDRGLADGEGMDNDYASSRKANDPESEYEKSEAESLDSEMVNVDSLASSARSSWKEVEQQEDEDDDALDSGSDQAESSSPDASMADMIPMLDELHPLLDEDAPQPIQMSRACSEAPSEQSPRSSTSSADSVDDTDNPEDSVAEGEEDDDDDYDAQRDKGFRTKSAITWTEEDQKNLMEVGSSEIERNQRLENLILRRRTRKNMSLVPEIDLIDLESSDFPINIASISTSRQNPFDMPDESYVISGLPPIPGSAPSILLPRRNPFDIPYDSSDEKQNMGDGSQEHKTLQSRDPFLRRRESFSVGPSVFAPNRQDLKLRPYFVPEQMDLEEPSYSTLQRQSSEVSDSKVSSVPDTESVSSVECGEDQKLEEEVTEECLSGDQDHVSKTEFSEEDAPYEAEVIPEMKHVTEDVGHGSQSSEGEESLELGSVENRESEVNDLKFQSESETVEQRHSRGSSMSSLSEVNEKVFTKIDDEDPSMLDGRRHDVAVGPDITSALSDDVTHKEPVYDSSPPAGGAKRANDDISSDLSGVDQRSDENFTDEQSQGDKNLGELEEEKHLTFSERESPVPIEARHVEGQLDVEQSVDKEETAMSPSSDAEFQEACEKISTPSAGGSTSHFYVRAMHEKDFEHLEEVQVPNTPVEPSEKARGIQSIHIPELRVLNRDVSPKGAVSHVDAWTMNEGADEIKGLSIAQRESGPRELEKHIDAERLSSPRLSETSDISSVEVNPVEVNKIEHEMDMENSRDEVEDIGTDHKREMMLTQEEVEPNTNAPAVEVKGETLESSSEDEESSFREDGGRIPEDPHATSDTETEKNSKSSSSFSSFWARKRLSTPFF
ncbi:hypothetical protein ACS0TY_031089 [Phlomoides rotata]